MTGRPEGHGGTLMSDPALKKSLNELAAVLKRVNEESDTLNTTISAFEQSLVDLGPGITVWAATPIRVQEQGEYYATGSQVGFAKGPGWGLLVRRGRFERAGTGWQPADEPNWKYVRLTDASREERAAAIDEFPALVEALTLAAKEHLSALERANKVSR